MYNPPLDGLDGPNVLALYEEGLPLAAIFQATGRRVSVIHAWLVRRGYHEPLPRPRRVKRRKRANPPPVTDDERAAMLALWAGGATISRIAAETRRSRATVRKALRAANVWHEWVPPRRRNKANHSWKRQMTAAKAARRNSNERLQDA